MRIITPKGIFALIVTILITVFLFIAHAQEAASGVKTWSRVYYGPGLADAYINSGQQQVRETLDRGYIAVANYLPSGSTTNNIWITRFDSSGNAVWQQTYGASGEDYASALAVSDDGSYVVAGNTSSFGNGSSANAWIMKIDDQGVIIWQNNIGFTTAGGNKKFSTVQQTSDGGYIAVGEAAINNSTGYVLNAFIVKFDRDGNILWSKVYGDGDAYNDRAYGVQQTPDGGYIVSGSSSNNAWIFKLDGQGILTWQKGYTISNAKMGANSVHLTSDGGYVAAGGYVNLSTYQQETFIMKLDAGGTIQLQKLFKLSPSYGTSSVFTIEQTKDSGYIALGLLSNHSWLLKLDQNWNMLWQHSYYGTWSGTSSDSFSAMQPASDGGYIMAGTAVSFDATKKRQAILAKVDSEGNVAGCAASLVHDITPSLLTKTIVPVTINSKEVGAKAAASPGPLSVLSEAGTKGTVCVEDPDIVISPSALDFGTMEMPAESSKTITITNSGYADLIISQISITGTDSNSFTQTNTCSTVAPTGSCAVDVTFSATSAGTRTASLSVSSNDPDTPAATVPLSGTAGDTIAPVSTTMITGTPGNNNWYVSDVGINVTATDYGSRVKEIHHLVDGLETVVPGNSASFSLVTSGTHTVNYYAIDNTGIEETPHHTLTIMIDKTVPDISASGTPLPNAWGWNNADVTVTFLCKDSPSGIAQCSGPVTVRTEGANQEVSGTAIDQAGNQASATIQLNIDKTPPLITTALSRNPNAYGWNNTDVTLTFSCADSLSGIASCPSAVTVATEGAGQIISRTAVDKAGNAATASVRLNIDKTPPAITASVSPNPNTNGWYNTDVTVSFSCSDTLSGIASCPSPINVTTEGAGQVITGTAADKAGNTAVASVTLNIDKTPPSITRLSASPAVLWPPVHRLVSVLINGSATDGSSGVATTSITVTDEYGIYNFTVPGFGSSIRLSAWRRGNDQDGRHYRITAVATDRAGNRATASTVVLVPHDMRIRARRRYKKAEEFRPPPPSAIAIATKGASQVPSRTAVDKTGNAATALGLNIDKTPPAITASVSPNPNANGWYNTDVTVSFSCSDTLSGIASCPSPIKVTTEGAGQVITGTAADKAGNTAVASVTLNIDKTPPSISFLSVSPAILRPTNHKMAYVLISGSATDELSDVASTRITVTDEYNIYNMTLQGFESTIQLEAWRKDTDLDGRHYAITAVATDEAGNEATSTTTVLVPHEMW